MNDNSWTSARIKQLRKDMGITQAKLAERLDLSEDTIQNWEVGRRKPNRFIQPLLAEIEESISKERR